MPVSWAVRTPLSLGFVSEEAPVVSGTLVGQGAAGASLPARTEQVEGALRELAPARASLSLPLGRERTKTRALPTAPRRGPRLQGVLYDEPASPPPEVAVVAARPAAAQPAAARPAAAPPAAASPAAASGNERALLGRALLIAGVLALALLFALQRPAVERLLEAAVNSWSR